MKMQITFWKQGKDEKQHRKLMANLLIALKQCGAGSHI